MDKTNKIKLFLIASIIIIVGAIVIYFIFLKPKPAPPSQPSTPTSSQGKISQIGAFPLKILFPDYANGKVFYQGYYQGELLEGEIATGKIEVIMEKKDLPDISEIVVSPSGAKILIRGHKGKFFTLYYLVETKDKKILATLNFGAKKATFLSDDKIIYHYKAEGSNTLNIADPDGQNFKKIIDLKEEIAYLNALGTDEIVYTNAESADTFDIIKTDGSGKGTIKLPVSINVNKLAWSSDGKSTVVAIREQNKTTDTFYKIDIKSGQKQEIKYQSEVSIDAQSPMLAKDGKTLYFTSDDFLYSLSF